MVETYINSDVRRALFMVRSLACLGILLASSPAWAAAPQSALRSWAVPPMLVAPARLAMNYGAITSHFRTAAHNRFVGGVPNSYHLLGQALDVARRPGVSHRMLETALRRAGFRLIESLDEGDHSHFAFALPGAGVTLASTASPPVPAPKSSPPLPPPPPRIRADEHGTLLIANSVLRGPNDGAATIDAGSQ